MGLARRAAGLTPLLTFTSIPSRFTIRRQTRLITNTMVGRRGIYQKGLTYLSTKGLDGGWGLEPGRSDSRISCQGCPQAMSRSLSGQCSGQVGSVVNHPSESSLWSGSSPTRIDSLAIACLQRWPLVSHSSSRTSKVAMPRRPPDGGQQQAIGAEGLCDAFAEVDGRFTWCPSLQVPLSVRAGHGDVDTEQEISSGVDCAV